MALRGIGVLLAFTTALLLRGPLGTANEVRRANYFRYVPDPKVVRLVSGAHRSSIADALWLRAIPDISRTFPDKAVKRRWLEAVFELINSLEPEFTTVYRFGATFLGFVDDQKDSAIALLERGVANNPDDLLLRVDLAMSWYLFKQNREKALEHLRIACEDERCDGVTRGFYATLLVEGRDDASAIMQWAHWMQNGDERVRMRAEWHLEKTKFQIARRAIQEFEAKSGRKPLKPNELADPALIDPQVQDVVLQGLELTAQGEPRYRRYEELQTRYQIELVEAWCIQYREDHGSWPSLSDVEREGMVKLPRPAPGRRYEVRDGKVLTLDA